MCYCVCLTISPIKIFCEFFEVIDVCGSSEEVSALIDNVLLYIADLVMDDDWEPEHKDLKLVMKDAKDDEMLEPEVEKEDIEVKVDADGFLSLR